jgi:cathepsin L
VHFPAGEIDMRRILSTSTTAAFAVISAWSGMALAQTAAPKAMMASKAVLTEQQLQANLTTLQATAKQRGWTFTPVRTGVSHLPLHSLAGELPPTPANIQAAPQLNLQASKVLATYRADMVIQKLVPMTLSCSAGLSAWDWRTQGKVTPPKQQGCGDCWAFATTAQIESAFLIAGWSQSDLAEQEILDCSGAGDCSGGRRWDALPWATTTTIENEPVYAYQGGVKGVCHPGLAGSHRLLSAGWIDSSGNVPSTATLKSALCQYGPISVGIYATAAMQSYGPGGQVFNEQNNGNGTNHAIVIIGWNDAKQAWLIKNSWGTSWGDGGFGWIHYGSNNIGRYPVFAVAPHPKYLVSPALLQELQKFHLATGLNLKMRLTKPN